MMTDPRTRTVIIGLEARKLVRATVTRVATVACLVLVTVTTAGGYAAAMRASDTDIGRKAASLVTSPGWGGYTGLGGDERQRDDAPGGGRRDVVERGSGVHR